ncbi:MAG: hypothetical protein Q8N99_05660 [Nanoarchaeota archaeon]|nr:hypothetical protein [Nanoarchaeota archaeon]
MGVIKSIFRYIIYLMIINIIILVIFAFSFNSLFYPDIYTKSFEKNNIYEYFDKTLEKASIKQTIIMPEEGIRGLINDKIDKVLSYVRSDSDELDLAVKLNKDAILSSVEKNIKSIQKCVKGASPIKDNKIICRPPEMTSKEFMNYLFKKNIIEEPEILKNDTIDLKELIDKDNNLSQLRKAYSFYKTGKYAVLAILLFLVFILFLLYLDSFEGFIKSLKIILVVSGAIGITIGYSMTAIASKQINNIAEQEPNLEPVFKSLAIDIIKGLSDKIFYISAFVFIIGITLIILSFIVSIILKFRKPSEEKKKIRKIENKEKTKSKDKRNKKSMKKLKPD